MVSTPLAIPFVNQWLDLANLLERRAGNLLGAASSERSSHDGADASTTIAAASAFASFVIPKKVST